MVQLHLNGVFVQRMNADERRVFNFARDKRLTVFQIKEFSCVVGRGRRASCANPGIHHVFRHDRLPSGPDQICPQMKCVGAAVGRNIPTLGQTGNGPGGFGIEPSQSLKQVAHHNAEFGNARDDGRVQRFRFRVVDNGDVRRWFAVNTAGRLKTDGGNQEAKNRVPPPHTRSLISGFRLPASVRGAFQMALALF